MLLDGFASLVGPRSVVHGTDGFDHRFTRGRYLAFRVPDAGGATGFVSLHDHARVNELARRWARVYAMVNVTDDDVRAGHAVPIGPLFGVRLRAPKLSLRHVTAAARHELARRKARSAGTVLLDGWKHHRRRAPISAYVPRASDPDYVFYAAWPWTKHPEVNPPRARFVEACLRAPGLTFEGGFAPRRHGYVPEATGLSATRRFPIREYLSKQARSAVAFNNPAVHGCLGWKLGEFLALGKAIVTLPLQRALPAPLEHGVHVHVVDGSDASLDDALERLRRDHAYRHALEQGARAWYEEYLAPEVVARRLLGALGVDI